LEKKQIKNTTRLVDPLKLGSIDQIQTEKYSSPQIELKFPVWFLYLKQA
jgi:hypothetical protein